MGVSFKRAYHELSDSDKQLVMMRLEGKSYSNILEYAKTQEERSSSNTVRKTIDDILHHDITEYDEYKYDMAFRLLDWKPMDFERVFGEPRIVFLFLNYHIPSKGSISIPKYLLTTKSNERVVINGLSLPYSPNTCVFLTLLLNPLNKRKRGYSAQNLVQFFRKQNLIIPFDILEGELRLNVNAVEILSGEYKFFDNTRLSSSYKKFFRIIRRKDGIYSVKKIYVDNRNHLNDLGIHSPLSLHDIIRKYRSRFDDNNHIKVLGYPNIVYGYRSKNEFFQTLPKRYHNRSFNQMIDELHEEYGLDKSYINYGYITINKDKLTVDGYVKNIDINFTERQVGLISKKLKSDYYTTDEFLRIIRSIKKSAPYRILETNELERLGYRKAYNYCIRTDIIDINSHLKKEILSQDFFALRLDEDIDSLLRSVVESLIKDFKLIRISDEEFITAKKLKKIGIYKKDIIKFFKDVNTFIGLGNYFTIKQLFLSGQYYLINMSSFDIRFFEELMNTSLKFDKIQIDGEILYCTTRNKVTRKDFMKWCFERLEDSVSIFDAVESINNRFKITVSQQTVKVLAEEIGLYYDKTFEKIYKNKNIFLGEVFSNEQWD